MNTDVLSALGISPSSRRPARLRSYKRVRIEGEVYPTIIPCDGAIVEGELQTIDGKLLPKLDEYEGTELGLYDRISVHVDAGSGEMVDAFVYVKGEKQDGITAIPWSYEKIREA